jgi:hypothetical protein
MARKRKSEPGYRYVDHAACASSVPAMTSWKIETMKGKVLGFIAVETPRKHDGLLFRISHLSPNRTTPTLSG